MTYFDKLTQAMTRLGLRDDTVFLGQQVAFEGSGMFKTLVKVPIEKRIEMPIMEDAQMGISIGLALAGKLPVTIFPRFDFLICAANQLVNHLDKIQDMSTLAPRVIIRTAVGSTKPLHPGLQHSGDYTEAFRRLLKNVKVVDLTSSRLILPAYQKAALFRGSTLIIERQDLYGMD